MTSEKFILTGKYLLEESMTKDSLFHVRNIMLLKEEK